MHPLRLAFACLVGLWLVADSRLGAQESTIGDLRIGVEGHFKRGHWAEVQAVVRAGASELAGELEVISRDGDGATAAFVCPQRVNLASQQAATLTTLVKMGPPRSGLRLRIRDGNRILAE